MSRSWTGGPRRRYPVPQPGRGLLRRLADYGLAVVLLGLLILLAARLDRLATRTAEGAAIINDGDSITLGAERIRMRGIDAPEYSQVCRKDGVDYPCGKLSRQYLVGLIAGQPVSCSGWQRDRYGRLLGDCIAGGKDQAYEIRPTIDGALTAILHADYPEAALHVRRECSVSSTEVDCHMEPTGPVRVTFPVTAHQAYTILVDSKSGAAFATGGIYRMELTLSPATCGNGVLELPEQCDDGNTTAGDGCSSTCPLQPMPPTATAAATRSAECRRSRFEGEKRPSQAKNAVHRGRRKVPGGVGTCGGEHRATQCDGPELRDGQCAQGRGLSVRAALQRVPHGEGEGRLQRDPRSSFELPPAGQHDHDRQHLVRKRRRR